MAKQALAFENFLSDIDPNHIDSAQAIHDFLVERGCGVKLQQAKSGHVVSFSEPGSDRVVANFVSRKKGPTIRIYADGVQAYSAVIEQLPADMLAQLKKSAACRRMLDPTKCNARCPMGFDFVIEGEHMQKCRYNCFMFVMDAQHNAPIKAILDSELQQRA